jgi:hypothetical protein
MNYSGQGKAQTLPLAIRERICHAILDGQTGVEILLWLNALPEVREHLAGRWKGEEISDKNFSDFKTGYFSKWLKRQHDLERQKALHEHALAIVSSSGQHLSSAAAALAAGKFLNAIECIGDDETPPEELLKAINDLRAGDIAEKTLALKEKQLGQKDREIELREEQLAWRIAEKVKAALADGVLSQVAAKGLPKEQEMFEFVRVIAGDDLLQRMKLRRGGA